KDEPGRKDESLSGPVRFSWLDRWRSREAYLEPLALRARSLSLLSRVVGQGSPVPASIVLLEPSLAPASARFLFARPSLTKSLPRWLGQPRGAPRGEFSMAMPLMSCLLVGPWSPGKSTRRFRSIRQDGLVRKDVVRTRNLAPLLEDELGSERDAEDRHRQYLLSLNEKRH